MHIETTLDTILELFDYPAFCVGDGVIRCVNQPAEIHGFAVGQSIYPMLRTDEAAYREFSGGTLYLNLSVGSVTMEACVSRLEQYHLFTLRDEQPELNAYARAARELRQPLTQILSVAENLFPRLSEGDNPPVTAGLAVMNRGFYQMLRQINNMSDAASCGISRMEIRDVSAVFEELMERIADLSAEAGFSLRFQNHPQPIYSLVDCQKLERATYNMISNAMGHCKPGDTIDVSLGLHRNAVCLTVINPGYGASVSASMFRQHLQEPGLNDSQNGLGLGFALIQAAAASHKGTFLLCNTPSGGIKATLQFPVCQRSDQLRSPALRLDYAGERDHGLVELSQFLPDHLFDPRNL